MCYLMPTTGYFLPYFKSNNIQSLAVLIIDTKLRKNPYAFEEGGTLLPCTIQVFAVPKANVEQTRKIFIEGLLSKLGKRIKNGVNCTVWFGINENGEIFEKSP